MNFEFLNFFPSFGRLIKEEEESLYHHINSGGLFCTNKRARASTVLIIINDGSRADERHRHRCAQ